MMLRGFVCSMVLVIFIPIVGFSVSPSNDNFSAALMLTGSSGQVSGSNFGATLETSEPVHIEGSPDAVTNTVWWKWTAPSIGPVVIRAESASFGPCVLVYTLETFALSKVYPEAGVWPDNEAEFIGQTGQTYWIAVGGYYGSSGPISLGWQQYPIPVNDDFVNAVELSGQSGRVSGANVRATREPGEPSRTPYYYGNRASVWWKWTAPSNGLVVMTAADSDFEATLTVYTGGSVTQLVEIASSNAGSVSFGAVAGTIYQISVEGFEWEWGAIDLGWSQLQSGSGAGYLASFFYEGGNPTNMQNADAQFRYTVTASPQDYQAKIYAALTRIGNLINDSDLKSLMARFGFNYLDSGTNSWRISGSFNPAGPLPSNQEVDLIWTRCQPAMDSAYDLLDSIPSNWTGTAEISWDCFPVDETVYVDYSDVVAVKAMLKTVRSFLNTVRAYDTTVDYQKLDWPFTAPVKAITVDGNSNDWATVPVQLYGKENGILNSVKACQNGNRIYVLIDRDAPGTGISENFDGSIMVRLDGVKTALKFGCYAGAFNWTRFEVGSAQTSQYVYEQSNMTVVATGGLIEMAFDIPAAAGTVTAVGCIDSVGWQNNSWWAPHEDKLDFISNYPATNLLAVAPDILKSVRNLGALTEAKSNLFDAVVLGQMAGGMIKSRSDNMLHFFEYDPADAIAYDDVMALMADIKTSLNQPVLFASGDGTSDVTVHLGAFYTAPYITRSMLPAYASAALLNNPTPGTFSYPTFGGILPNMTQGSLSAGLAGYPLNVPAPSGAVASLSTSLSKIEISWLPVEGADRYEVWRSASSDFSGAVKVATVDVCGYADSNLEPGSTYYYKVRGGNDYQTGAFSTSPIVGITRARLAMPWLNLLLE